MWYDTIKRKLLGGTVPFVVFATSHHIIYSCPGGKSVVKRQTAKNWQSEFKHFYCRHFLWFECLAKDMTLLNIHEQRRSPNCAISVIESLALECIKYTMKTWARIASGWLFNAHVYVLLCGCTLWKISRGCKKKKSWTLCRGK